MKKIISRILRTLKHGIKIPFTTIKISLCISREDMDGDADTTETHLRYLQTLAKKLPDLAGLIDSKVEDTSKSHRALIDFYNEIIPIRYPEAKEAYLRSRLYILRKDASHGLLKKIDLEIAESNLRDGVVERSLMLKDEPDSLRDLTIQTEIKKQAVLFNKNYGSKIPFLESRYIWDKTPDVRGKSLVYYFKKHLPDLRNKRILHFSPEKALRDFLNSQRPELGIEYLTIDAFDSREDLTGDITSLKLNDSSFDLIICHRVLEHVLEDEEALNELYRILRSSGELNISVPQSMNRERTLEWIIPDLSHSGHIRQYGIDFETKLQNAGFRVEVIRELLDMSAKEHIRNKTYPMRLYRCLKA